jgi:hypothetical protein
VRLQAWIERDAADPTEEIRAGPFAQSKKVQVRLASDLFEDLPGVMPRQALKEPQVKAKFLPLRRSSK